MYDMAIIKSFFHDGVEMDNLVATSRFLMMVTIG
jgi:hypothetical protein